MIRAVLMRTVFLAATIAVAAGALVTAAAAGYRCGYLKAWSELQSPPPVILFDDALLEEATHLCRTLAEAFPDDPDYQARLARLLSYQAEHGKADTRAANKVP